MANNKFSNYFSFTINKELESVEISESGETLSLDFEHFEDLVKCINEAHVAFLQAKKEISDNESNFQNNK